MCFLLKVKLSEVTQGAKQTCRMAHGGWPQASGHFRCRPRRVGHTLTGREVGRTIRRTWRPSLRTEQRTLLGAPGHTTRSKEASRLEASAIGTQKKIVCLNEFGANHRSSTHQPYFNMLQRTNCRVSPWTCLLPCFPTPVRRIVLANWRLLMILSKMPCGFYCPCLSIHHVGLFQPGCGNSLSPWQPASCCSVDCQFHCVATWTRNLDFAVESLSALSAKSLSPSNMWMNQRTNSNKKLLGTSASLLVTGALLVVTRSY